MKFKLNRRGVGELLKSDEMRDAVQHYASEIAQRAGEGYEANVSYGDTRTVAFVKASTPVAKLDNEANNTLLKSLKG